MVHTGTSATRLYTSSAIARTPKLTLTRLLLVLLAIVGVVVSLFGAVTLMTGLYSHQVMLIATGATVTAAPWIIAHIVRRGLEVITGNTYRIHS